MVGKHGSTSTATKPAGAEIRLSTPWLGDLYRPGGNPLPFTDLGNAKRLALGSGSDIRYCHTWKKWLFWDGRRWIKDEIGEIHRRAKQAVIGMLFEAATADESQRKAIIAWQQKSEAEPRIRAMIKLAESEPGIPVHPSELDVDIWLLNCHNGTLDLRTRTLREHRREDLITKLVPVAHDPEGKCPIWLSFLDRAASGSTDLKNFLKRATGYSLTGSTREHCLFLLYGTGANGKTTFLEALRYELGNYGMQAAFDSFMTNLRGNGIRNDLARLAGARLVTATEGDDGRRLAESIIKHLTGGDTVTARFLYGEHFEFRPQFKLWLATNHRPVIRGTDEGIWRRIRLVPFTITIPPEERDPDLIDKLRGEAAGILNWALDGLTDYLSEGLKPPAEVIAATAEYREDQDILQHFIDSKCVMSPTAYSTAAQLYASYKSWREETGEHQISQRAFGLALREHGFQKVPRRNGIEWHGIGLREGRCEGCE